MAANMMMRTRSSHPSKSTRRTDFGPRRAASPSRTGTPGCPTSPAAPSAASSPPRCSSRSWHAERGTGRAPRRSSDETRRRLSVHPLVDLRDMPVGGLEPWPAGLLRHLRFDGYLRESLDALREAQDQNNCRSLVGGNGTAWSSSATSYTYFRIDTASTPGYLTAQ